MAYNDQRVYIGTLSAAAQNIVSTASGAIVVGTGTLGSNIPTGEATFLCSITALATSAAPTCGQMKSYAIISGSTYTGGPFIPTLASAAGGVSTFIPSIAIGAGVGITAIGIVATGTASATQTAPAVVGLVGVAPQFV